MHELRCSHYTYTCTHMFSALTKHTLYITHLLQQSTVFLEFLDACLVFSPLLMEKGQAQLNVFYSLRDRSLGPMCVG